METGCTRAWMRLVVAVGACAVLGLPTTATAQTYRHRDTIHDVAKVYDNDMIDMVSRNRTADIRTATFAHSSASVTATVKLRGYKRQKWSWSEEIQTPARWYYVMATKRLSRHLHLRLIATATAGGDGSAVPCRGLSSLIRPAHHTVRVSVPTRCLGSPDWVTTGLFYSMPAKGSFGLWDDALLYGLSDFGSRGPTASPRLSIN